MRSIKDRLFHRGLFIYKIFISLKLAVFSILTLAILTGIGTFIESKYNQEIANKLIYHSLWMKMAFLLLAINLTMVLIDRYPWKKHQVGFVLAHIGILTLMLGFVFTQYLGLDGTLRLKEGEKSSLASISGMEIQIHSSYDGENWSLIYEKPVDMLSFRPSEKKPYLIQTAGEAFIIDQHIPFALGREIFKNSEKGGEPAIRFHLSGQTAQLVEWMKLDMGETSLDRSFGPALIRLTKNKNKKTGSKALILFVEEDKIFYSLPRTRKKALRKGQSFPTGWMDLQFRLLEFFPKAQREFVFSAKDRPSSKTLKAIRISHQGKVVWIGQNSYVRFFKEDRVYAVAYRNQTHNLTFDIELVDFKMTTYPASRKAKSYESQVLVEGQKALISMNKPLKHKGWTFYQSSFESSPDGAEPNISILSVNRDPGRALKYTGSFLIVMGSSLLFYRRRKKMGTTAI